MTKLFRVACRIPSAYAITDCNGRSFEHGKLYPADALTGFSGETLARHFDAVAELPTEVMPTTIGEIRPFVESWLGFLLSELAGDWAEPWVTMKPLLKRLRDAIAAIPQAPPLPDERPLRGTVLTDFVNELKRLRELIPEPAPIPAPAIPQSDAEALPEPLDWAKLVVATKGAPKQHELVRMLIERKDWVTFADLRRDVWSDSHVDDAAVEQMIKRANKTLTKIAAKMKIQREGSRAKALFL